jgi:hypothetical protein
LNYLKIYCRKKPLICKLLGPGQKKLSIDSMIYFHGIAPNGARKKIIATNRHSLAGQNTALSFPGQKWSHLLSISLT